MKNVAYQCIKGYLDKHNLRYNEDNDSKSAFYLTFETKDFPIQNKISVMEKPNLLSLYSYFDFEVEEEKRVETLMGISMINFELSSGCFDFDLNTGHIIFRIQTCYPKSGQVEDEFIDYLLMLTNHIVDYFNDKLFFLISGKSSLEDFYQQVKAFGK